MQVRQLFRDFKRNRLIKINLNNELSDDSIFESMIISFLVKANHRLYIQRVFLLIELLNITWSSFKIVNQTILISSEILIVWY